jgi:hypothetical protein
MNKPIHRRPRRRTYDSWQNMIRRCTNPACRSFQNYGGRGITVCERWLIFDNFLEDMGPPNDVAFMLDRIDVNGNYEPSNCRWATHEMQANNNRNNRRITFKGETKTLRQWVRLLNMPEPSVSARLNRLGWPVELALTVKPVMGRNQTWLAVDKANY